MSEEFEIINPKVNHEAEFFRILNRNSLDNKVGCFLY